MMAAAPREPATVSRLAEFTKFDRKTVSARLLAAEAEGRVSRIGERWPVEAALAILRSDVDPARVAGHSVVGRGEQTSPELASLSRSRAASEAARARKLELENERRAGNLVQLADVRSAGTDLVIKARQAFLSLGHRVAGRVVGKTDPLEVAQLIEGEARLILAELSDAERFVDALLTGEGDA